MKWLWSRETGIRGDWDPTNLADTIALFSHCNFGVSDIKPSTTRRSAGRLLDNYNFRLGYWEVTRRNTTSVVYGIRCVGKLRRRTVKPRDIKSVRHRPQTPYNQIPFLYYVDCIAWGVSGVLCLAGLICIAASGLFTRKFMIQDKSFTDLTNDTNLTNHRCTTDLPFYGDLQTEAVDGVGDSPDLAFWSAVLRLLPLFVIGSVVGMLTNCDYHHRWSQPLLNMYQGPSTAEKTILLDYITPSMIGVLSSSWEHGEWKVFYYVLLNALVPLLRLLPVGILSMVNTGQGIICQFSLTFIIATIIMLAVVLASQASTWYSRKRLFPRGGTSLLDVWLLCFRSQLVKTLSLGNADRYGPKRTFLRPYVFAMTNTFSGRSPAWMMNSAWNSTLLK